LHTAFAKIVDPQPTSGAQAEFRFNITHAFTPESHGSIHYWWFNSRNFKLDDQDSDVFLHTASAKAYLEDVDALEWIWEVVQNDNQPQFDLNFAPDKPGLLMRRVIHERAAAEAGVSL
jgi:vanillate O-demethylase monooxygenase subunit